MGYQALQNLTSGSQNVAMGALAGNGATTTGDSVFLGKDSGRYRDVSELTFVGIEAGRGSTTTANNTGTGLVAVGARALQSSTSASNNVAIGMDASAKVTTGNYNTSVGHLAGYSLTTGASNTLIGSNSDTNSASIDSSTAIGKETIIGASSSIAIGALATTTAANQVVIGSSTVAASDVYIGNGVTDVSPSGVSINASGASGTDIAGASLTLSGGKGTGNAATGSAIVFKTSDAGVSGTTLQSLTTKMTLTKAGDLELANTPTSASHATRKDYVDTKQGASTQTLSDGANISWNISSGTNATVTLAGNRTIDNPTNMVAGQMHILIVNQDGTGGRTLAWGTAYLFEDSVDPVVSTGISDKDIFQFYCDGTNMINLNAKFNVG